VDPRLLGHDMAYPAMLTFLPEGLLGLMVAGLLAAYVSTLSTHLNWGTSYLVHDWYRRFVRDGQPERHYVMVGRLTTALLMLAAALFTLLLETARASFDLLLSVGAGTGLLYLLRWFWWRINAWTEIAAMASSFLLALALFVARRRGLELPSHVTLLTTVAVTTLVWVATAVLTRPTEPAVLRAFYRIARPAGPGWRHVRAECPDVSLPDNPSLAFAGWLGGLALVYGALFGAGLALFGRLAPAAIALAVGLAGAVALLWVLPRLWTAPGPSPSARS
jgi:Na+/proline symporter